mmetsp:Transcript_5403/g.17092  ORF Transcript_5403/g.17092 Transcript_5403/m.17092 type:complete len:263 (+) Transcript_5403:897-1685(+)
MRCVVFGGWAVDGGADDVAGSVALEAHVNGLAVLRHANGRLGGAPLGSRLRVQLALEPAHFVLLAVDQDDVGGSGGFDELGVLKIISVRRKRNGDDRAPAGLHAAVSSSDLVWLGHEFFCQRALDGVARDDDAVPRVRAPPVEELPGDAGLKHARRGEDDAGPDVVDVVDGAHVGHVREPKRVPHVHLPPDVLVHHVDVRLVDAQRPGRELGGVEDGHAVQVAAPAPVLVQDQQQLLRAPEREDGDEAPPAALDDALHCRCK